MNTRRGGHGPGGSHRGRAQAADFEAWLERQYQLSAQAVLRAISAPSLCKSRFGRVVRAAAGSVVASPVLGAYDPEPDYFFHWFRDAAVVIDALRLLHAAGTERGAALARFGEFVRFELDLLTLDGRALGSRWRQGVEPRLAQFARTDAELVRLHGAAIAAETRVNPDGTLDLLRWPRPQHDGPALRALTLLRWCRTPGLEPALLRDCQRLLRADLQFVSAHWQLPCYDMWEEELGLHYHVLCVSAAALTAGADWLTACGEAAAAEAHRIEARAARRALDAYWLPAAGHYRSRVLANGSTSAKELDVAVIFGVIHAAQPPHARMRASAHALAEEPVRHGPGDPQVWSTLTRLEALFDARYAINRDRPSLTAPAMGRYADDVYFSGGAYYFSTLAAAELCFLAAEAGLTQPRASSPAAEPRDWFAHGEAFLRTVRHFTPDDGALSEQFDRDTGAQTSARHLTWSYAAFICAVTAHRRVRAWLEQP